MEELIAKRYVKALESAYADKQGSLEILSVLTSILQDPKTAEFFDSPLVSDDRKVEILLEALGDLDGKLKNFIKLLGEHKRISLIPEMKKVLSASLQREKGLYEGVVESNQKLDDALVKRLEKSLKSQTGVEVVLKQKSSDNDGLFVKVEDLGIEVQFSKEKVKRALVEYIKQAL